MDMLPGGSEKILFVDDEDCLLETFSELLSSRGYEVISASSGKEALEKFSENPAGFDLVFTDHSMPVMTGFELAARLIAIRSDIPIILCTGFCDNISEQDVKKIGIKEFIHKPIEFKKLATLTREVLDQVH